MTDYNFFDPDAFSAPAPDTTPDFNSSVTNDPTAILSDQGGIGQFAAAAGSLLDAIGRFKGQGAANDNNAAIAAQNAKLSLQQLQGQYKIAQIQSDAQVALAQRQAMQTGGGMFGSGSSLVMVLAVAGLVVAALQFAKK